MKWSSLLLLFLSIFVFIQCEKDGSLEDPILVSDVDERLIKYFEEFEKEGAKRGLEIDLAANGITGSIEDIPISNVAGRCQYGTHSEPHVTLDSKFWNSVSELVKEMVIFHELGHCYLLRDHNENKLENGICESIMRSGDGSCFDNYTTQTREYYLDELFLNN